MLYSTMITHPEETFKLITKKLEKPRKNDLTIKVKGCYICGSDVKTIRYGNDRVAMNRVMGHEIAGTVSDLGEQVKGYSVGDKVVLGADFPCLDCEMCFKEDYDNCTRHLALGHEIDGGFSEYITIPKTFIEKGPIIKVGTKIPLSLAALAEPVGCCIRGIKKKFFPEKVSTVSIIGGGPIGAIISTIFKIKFPNIKINIFEPSDARRNLLAARDIGNNWYGSTETLKDNSAGNLVFVACSVLAAQKEALRIVDHGGTVCLFGGINKTINIPVVDSNDIHYKELCVYGTTGSNKSNVGEALDLICNNHEEFQKLISATFPLPKLKLAFDEAYKGEILKIFIECS